MVLGKDNKNVKETKIYLILFIMFQSIGLFFRLEQNSLFYIMVFSSS